MNCVHLMQHPGSTVIAELGGLHRMIGWEHPIVTDSGGFQIYSLIRQDPKLGTITKEGALFRPRRSARKFKLTPAKSIRLQFGYGADVLICLDDCTHVDSPYEEQQASVERTISWARQCRETFDQLAAAKELSEEERPMLFGVIQGGGHRDLRRQCAEALIEIGFDGFGYGGWPLDGEGNLLLDMLSYTRELVPAARPMHALGIGHPQGIVECHRLGYDLFDSTMPTRDARHGRLYAFNINPGSSALVGDWFSYVYVRENRSIRYDGPISEFCDCLCCKHYSLGYLHHLETIGDGLYHRLATMHNLRFMTQLTAALRGGQ